MRRSSTAYSPSSASGSRSVSRETEHPPASAEKQCARAGRLFHVKQINEPATDSSRQLQTDLEQLRERLRGVGICLDDQFIPHLWQYACLLSRWSHRMSLVSSGDRGKIFTKHIGPACLMAEVVKSVPHSTVVDYGSGAGLPGIPLKILFPHSQFYLVEARRKRTSFLQTAVRTLELPRVAVVHQRLEEWRCPSGPVDLVVSRATAGTDLVEQVRAHLAPHGSIVTTQMSTCAHPNGSYSEVRKEFSGFPTITLINLPQ